MSTKRTKQELEAEALRILEQGPDLNAPVGEAGSTLLLETVKRGMFPLVKGIIEKGLVTPGWSINHQNDKGETALHLAAMYGRETIAKHLTERYNKEKFCFQRKIHQ